MLRQLYTRPIAREFLRFITVGVFTTGVLFAVLYVLAEFLHWPPWLAALCGYVAGGVPGYALNRSFTFGSSTPFTMGLAKYASVVALGAVVNAAIVWVLTSLGLHYLVAQCISTALVLMWNFLGSRLFVFRAGE